ncbi:PaaI family thioesterase [Roseospira marina]|uniref:Medium/long-chain acyl-CoA thioesterase YigI n=1 Tax=Roseospira marina TaxID=140057 RepID=A0A5M6IEQ2_9PROT|nr:PaaI family thioesterase [Roseospira marina]KAA5606753.1 PaaI family thioesterase [Roseospira marina]MBB4313827.1 uncharacterized protein (TIGR00369 family) [Roseospira marina]MBB5086989.1 uncharacterized protein (TIGR00369 family) [Roseospira marina]
MTDRFPTTTPSFSPGCPDYVQRVRDSFARQAFMTALGARVADVAPGAVDLELPFRADLTQQNGFLHAGVTAALADSAAGYAAYSLMPPDSDVLSIEFKHNLLSPAVGSLFRAHGRVLRAGRQIVVVQASVVAALDDDTEKTVALMQATMMQVRRDG